MSYRSRPQTVTPSRISRPSSQQINRSSSLTNSQTRPNTASKIPTLRPKSVGRQQQQQQQPKPNPVKDGALVPDHLPHRLGHLPRFLKRIKENQETPSQKLTVIRELESWMEDLMALPNIEDETLPPLVDSGVLDVVCGNWDRQKTFTM